jgi:hypothetical protein
MAETSKLIPQTSPAPAPKTGPISPASAGAIVFVLFAIVALRWFQPALPRGFELEVVFAPGMAGLSEPLIVSGTTGLGDFLFVRHLDETHAVLGHERWGTPPVLSAPFEVKPATPRRLVVDVPAFSHTRGGSRGGNDILRVQLDGVELLNTTTRFELRKSSHLFFAENPLGGTACGPTFSGTLSHLDGRSLLGNARRAFSWSDRLIGWFTDGKWQVAFVLLVSVAAACGWIWLQPAPRNRISTTLRTLRHVALEHRAFIAAAAICSIGFIMAVTGGTGRLWFKDDFGDFYDLQAAALLQGRLDVPAGAISGEAFIFDRKYYGYFGPTPALLRLPFAIFDLGTGWLTRSFMLLQFLGALLAAYAILREFRRLVTPECSNPPGWMALLFTFNVGLGSTLFYLASRAYIYHEATLCGSAFALASTAFALRHLSTPNRRTWLLAFGFGLLSLHARPPTGLFALTLLSIVSLALAYQAWRRHRAPLATLWPQAILWPLTCVIGVLSFNTLSYLKFKSLSGAPLHLHVQYPPERLAQIEGKNFHVANFPYVFRTYTWQPNFTLRPTFPWFYITGENPREDPNARIDLAEPTLALPYAMPALTLLATLVMGIACWRRPTLRLPAVVVGLSIIPMGAAMVMAVAVSHRYTTDFCPWIITLAALGLAGVPCSLAWKRLLLLLTIPFTVLSITITLAITIHYQGALVWGVPPDASERYRTLRISVDSVFGVKNPELHP